VPIDSNQNPEGAHLDEDRFFARFGYDRTLSDRRLVDDAVLHALGPAAVPRLPDRGVERLPNARGFRADIDTNDLYFDTHLAWTKSPSWHLVAGADYLFGKAEAKGDTFDYGVELTATARRPTSRRASCGGSRTRATSWGSTPTSSGFRPGRCASTWACASTTRPRSGARARKPRKRQAKRKASAATRGCRAASA
jgi:hypothetical protein